MKTETVEVKKRRLKMPKFVMCQNLDFRCSICGLPMDDNICGNGHVSGQEYGFSMPKK